MPPQAPPAAASAPAASTNGTAADQRSAADRGRALLVEDNPEVAAVVEGMLSAAGFSVASASSGATALARLGAGERFDLVLSDIVMEGLSGLDLASRIREREPGLPVILMTGYSDALLLGSSNGLPVLSKPFRYEELEALLAQLRGSKATQGRGSAEVGADLPS